MKWGTGLSRDELKGLTACREALGDQFRLGVLLHGGQEAVAAGERLVALPNSTFFGRD